MPRAIINKVKQAYNRLLRRKPDKYQREADRFVALYLRERQNQRIKEIEYTLDKDSGGDPPIEIRIDGGTRIKNAFAVFDCKASSYESCKKIKSRTSEIPLDQQEIIIKETIRKNVRLRIMAKSKNLAEAEHFKSLYKEFKGTKAAQKYLTECFYDYINVELVIYKGSFDLNEMLDPRDAFSMKDVSRVKPLSSGHLSDEKVRLAKGLIRKYPDFYMLYCWLAFHYRCHHNLAQARMVLDEGIRHSLQKHDLFTEYGWVEKEDSNLREAVKWWIKSAILQIISTATLDDYIPFMYLAYIANYSGLEQQQSRLFEMTDCIRAIRLDSDGQHDLQTQCELQKQVEILDYLKMRDAIQLFVATFGDKFQKSFMLSKSEYADQLRDANRRLIQS